MCSKRRVSVACISSETHFLLGIQHGWWSPCLACGGASDTAAAARGMLSQACGPCFPPPYCPAARDTRGPAVGRAALAAHPARRQGAQLHGISILQALTAMSQPDSRRQLVDCTGAGRALAGFQGFAQTTSQGLTAMPQSDSHCHSCPCPGAGPAVAGAAAGGRRPGSEAAAGVLVRPPVPGPLHGLRHRAPRRLPGRRGESPGHQAPGCAGILYCVTSLHVAGQQGTSQPDELRRKDYVQPRWLVVCWMAAHVDRRAHSTRR